MTAHQTADTIQANADAFRVMDGVDKAASRKAWRETYAEELAKRERLDAEIDADEEEMRQLKQRMLTKVIERTEAHRNVLRATDQLAALEQGEGR